MREHRRRSVLLICVFVVVLAATAAGVCAGAAAPARAAALPPHGIWWDVLGKATSTESWVDVAKGPDGSLYAGGWWNTVLGGDTGDLLVAKVDKNDQAASHLIWSHIWDNPVEHLQDRVSAIAVDHSGAVILAGFTETASNGAAWVVAKWDTNGGPAWQKTFAASALIDWDAYAYDVACDAAGNVYVCGMVQTGTGAGSDVSSLVVRKLASTDSHLIWKGSYAGPSNSFNQGSHLALDRAGNAYCTGYGQNAHGDSDIITCKVRSSDGRLLWVRRIAGAKQRDDEGAGVVVRGAHVWVTGGVYTSATTRAVALAKYTTAGKRLWLHTWLERAKTIEHPNALAVDNHGHAVVVGAGNDNPVTREHAFILRFSAAGRLQWRRITYDSVSHKAQWQDVVCDAAGRIWTGGYTVNGSSDSFLVAGYSATGTRTWRSAWKGPDGLGGECNTLCFGKTGLFAGGVVTTTAGGGDAAAVKFTK
jgi:hypothetical protein